MKVLTKVTETVLAFFYCSPITSEIPCSALKSQLIDIRRFCPGRMLRHGPLSM